MKAKEDMWMLRSVFELSDRALIRMTNRLFRTFYGDGEQLWKEWHEQQSQSVCLKIGETNRYEFQVRRLDGCLRISAEDRGGVFGWGKAVSKPVVQIREPQIIYFGKARQEEYSTTLEFPGNARVTLPIHLITLEECSPAGLEEQGLIPFLPFLAGCFIQKMDEADREGLRRFLVQDIGETLMKSYRKGDLTALDMQRLKQLCRKSVWKLCGSKSWMQELVLDALEPDLDFLQRAGEK
ncbi:MAG: hypothetical protein Q4C82_02615 [Eubacteriales bacterium]|nr:hypothetical protein [Eubacteriales bacterium]